MNAFHAVFMHLHLIDEKPMICSTFLEFTSLCMYCYGNTVPLLVGLVVYLWGLFSIMVYDLIDLSFSVLTVYDDAITRNRWENHIPLPRLDTAYI